MRLFLVMFDVVALAALWLSPLVWRRHSAAPWLPLPAYPRWIRLLRGVLTALLVAVIIAQVAIMANLIH